MNLDKEAMEALDGDKIYSDIPAFNDEILMRLIRKLHIFDTSCYGIQYDANFKSTFELIRLFFRNPYNAYRIIDCIMFLFIANAYRFSSMELFNKNEAIKELINLPILNTKTNTLLLGSEKPCIRYLKANLYGTFLNLVIS